MTHPTWFEFIRTRLPAVTMPQATCEYVHTYYPAVYEDAKLIADEAIARSKQLEIPDEAGMPDDHPAGVQLLAALIEERASDS